MTPEMRDAIETVEEFLSGTGNMWAWDDFLSVPPRDPEVKKLQVFCGQLRYDYPPDDPIEYCNEKGKHALRGHIDELIKKDTTSS